MLFKRTDVRAEDQAPDLDEGWWASVLADEDTFSATRAEAQSRSQTNGMASVDWDHVQDLFEQDEIITLQVTGYNRGGLLVQGELMQGFVPVSHLIDVPTTLSEDERQNRLAGYVGRTLDLKVIECEPSLERIVLSERAALAGEGRRKQLFQSLRVGQRVQGHVTNVTDFGVFVDLGGVEGLIHVSELSWGRVQHPGDICAIGDPVETLVLQVCEETSRVALSLKQLTANPWEHMNEAHHPGEVVPAEVTAIMRFGAFARLPEGVEGLIHISSITLPEGIKNLEYSLHVGQPVQVRILHVDANRRRLGLGLVSLLE